MESKGLKSAIMCVLVLGLILEQVQVEGKSCCKNTLARNCYNVCRLKFSQKTCANSCSCKIITGNKCPSDYPKSNILLESDEPDAVQYCNLGCMSSLCDTMNDVFVSEEMKIDMERSCSDECDRVCNSMASVTA